jgi:hypothetical protein
VRQPLTRFVEREAVQGHGTEQREIDAALWVQGQPEIGRGVLRVTPDAHVKPIAGPEARLDGHRCLDRPDDVHVTFRERRRLRPGAAR